MDHMLLKIILEEYIQHLPKLEKLFDLPYESRANNFFFFFFYVIYQIRVSSMIRRFRT